MKEALKQQIVISGVGGQGVLFVTRLLAEAAIRKGLPVLTSETHGMAQRGGTVISHLKVGPFSSPLIRTGQADLLLALKNEGAAQHGHYLHAAGRAVINGAPPEGTAAEGRWAVLKANDLAREAGDPRAVNLVILGAALGSAGPPTLFCTREDIEAVLAERLAARSAMRETSTRALAAGWEAVHP